MISLTVNGKTVETEATPDTPLLWVLRDALGLTGTKYGCGMAQCGACTVHLDGKAVRACVTPLRRAAGKDVVTIEAIELDRVGHAVQQAWLKIDVPQCGYCQSGQIMSAVALLGKNPAPTDADSDVARDGNLCRCGTYNQVREAIHEAAAALKA